MESATTSVAIIVPDGPNEFTAVAVITRYANLLMSVSTHNGIQWNERPSLVSNVNDLQLILRDLLYVDDYDVTGIHYRGYDIPPTRFMEFPWEMRIIQEHKFQFHVGEAPSEVCAVWAWNRLN